MSQGFKASLTSIAVAALVLVVAGMWSGVIGIRSDSVIAAVAGAQAAPTISSLSVTSGYRGAQVTITGTGFADTNTLIFMSPLFALNALAGQTFPSTDTGTKITFTVPQNAIMGINKVQVSTAGGTSAKKDFTVTTPPPAPAPTITSLTPSSGLAGTVITITGTGFTATNNTVYYFGDIGYTGGIASNNGTTLAFRIPAAILKPFSITLRVGNANGQSNAKEFKVTK
jgi:hypothetical protein